MQRCSALEGTRTPNLPNPAFPRTSRSSATRSPFRTTKERTNDHTSRVCHRVRRRDLTLAEAADVVAVTNDPRLYHQLVLEQGWTPERFQTWLAETMKAQLLGPLRRGR